MVLYFSSTGNSKYVAEQIAKAFDDRAVSIEKATDTRMVNDKIFGIVFPTYFFEMPPIVVDFMKKMVLRIPEGCYRFVVSTCGGFPASSLLQAGWILGRRRVRVDGLFSVTMPDSWAPLYKVNDQEKNLKTIAKADEKINEIIENIKNNKKCIRAGFWTPSFFRYLTDWVYQLSRKTSHLKVNNNCIGCGVCAVKCPDKAIEMKDNRPVFVKDKCQMCLRCYHRCSRFAIYYDLEKPCKKHGQYKNPKVIL